MYTLTVVNDQQTQKIKTITNLAAVVRSVTQPLRKRLCILISLPTRWKSSGPNLTALNRVKLAVVENLAEIVASNVLSSTPIVQAHLSLRWSHARPL